MQQVPRTPQIQIKRPVLVFLKNGGPPLVLYTEDSEALYDEIKQIIVKATSSAPKLIEKTGNGPLKKVSFIDTHVAGVAIQEEQHIK